MPMAAPDTHATARGQTDAGAKSKNVDTMIDAVRQAAKQDNGIGGTTAAKIMAACWQIQCDIPDDDAFRLTIERNLTGILKPDHALAMAETWNIARSQRYLRTLAMDDPNAAIAFVQQLTDAAGAKHVRTLDEDDPEVEELLSIPPRKRRAQLRTRAGIRRGTPPMDKPAVSATPPTGGAPPHPSTPKTAPAPSQLESPPTTAMTEPQAIDREHADAIAAGILDALDARLDTQLAKLRADLTWHMLAVAGLVIAAIRLIS